MSAKVEARNKGPATAGGAFSILAAKAELADQPMRFAELRRAVPGLSDRLLSRRLRELETAGLISRRVEDGLPVKVTYDLTEKGRSLKPAIQMLREWACDWHQEPVS